MSSSLSDYSYLLASGENWGSCYRYNYKTESDIISANCTESLSGNCDGIYHKAVGCTGSMYPDLQKYNTNFWTSHNISSSSLSNIKIGSMFAGGIYAGIYTPIGISFNDKINTITSTDTETYALIIYPEMFDFPYLKKDYSLKSNTSYYNGKYNLILEEGNSKQPPVNFDNTVFRDWHWPSIAELFFIKNQYEKYSRIRTEMDKMLNTTNSKTLISSSVFSISPNSGYKTSSNINNNNYLYGLDIAYGSIFLMGPYINTLRACIRTIKVDV